MNQMNVKKWTPIQEGRFHLRKIKDGENVARYVSRIYPDKAGTDRAATIARVGRSISLARQERSSPASAS